MALQNRSTDNESNEEYGLISIRWHTDEEGFAEFDLAARRRLNMSGEEFLRRWKAGEFSEDFKDEHHSAFAALSIRVAPFANDDAS